MAFLFVDGITQQIPAQSITGFKSVTPQDIFLEQDADGRSCFLPTLTGEAVGQLAAWLVMAAGDFHKRPVAGIAAEAVMHHKVFVGETLILHAEIDSLDDAAVCYHGDARVGDRLVFTIDGAIGPLLPMEQFIDPEQARAQYAAITSGAGAREVSPALPRAPIRYHEILDLVPGAYVEASLRVDPDAPYFPDHFPHRPVLPMTILLACTLHLAETFMLASMPDKAFMMKQFQRIKMKEFVTPGDVVQTRLEVKAKNEKQWVLRCISTVGTRHVCVAECIAEQII